MTEETLFELALNTPEAEREALLDRQCAGESALRARVEALLAAHRQIGAMPDAASGEATAADPGGAGASGTSHTPTETVDRSGGTVDRGPAERVGAILAGKYKLVEEIGEGGMGSVFLAQQTEPVRRVVAVKVIKAGMDSRAVLQRFEAERQALAMMDHPNIARVLDAGTTDSGRPFFVMELVKGVPITRFCDERRLTPRERLELFVPLCQAIQHAHQKGVIHRDVKPSNVLVALYDDRPVPKVIDFGVAKATGAVLTEHSLLTGFGAVVGTPEYMSPEQAGLNNLDIDTRSDVYALGVLLYELLTGSTPVDRKRLKQAAMLEVLRVVREEEPPSPSAKLSTLDTLPSVAASRGVEPARLSRMVRGELDWIVMKALEKDRGRRYETANAFARDVQRYLADEVVEARPPSAGYRLRKFIRRHKGRVVAASLVLAALLAGIAGTTWGYLRAERRAEGERLAKLDAQGQRDKAIRAEQAERAARRREEVERKYAQAIADFVRDDFLALTSVEGQGRFGDAAEDRLGKDATLRQLLDRAATKLDARSDLAPRTEADLRWMIGVSYREAGEAARAIPYLERSVAIRREVLGVGDEGTLNAMNSLAVAYLEAGDLARALPLHEETLELKRSKLGADHPDTLASMGNLAMAYAVAGDMARALPLYEETLRLRRVKLGPDHPYTLTSMGNLAMGYLEAGDLTRALPLLEETLQRKRAELGADHPSTLASMGNLAAGYQTAGDLARALPLHEEALELKRAELGADHPDTHSSMGNLAACLWGLGRLDRSIPLFEDLLQRREKVPGRSHPETQMVVANLGVNYMGAGRLEEAIPLLEEAERAGRSFPNLRWVADPLLDAYTRAGDVEKARALIDRQPTGSGEGTPANRPRRAWMLAQFGFMHLQRKAFAEAEPPLRESLAIRREIQPDDWTTFSSMSMLGGALLGQGEDAEAEPLLRESYEGLKARKDQIPPGGRPCLGEALDRLIAWAEAAGEPDEAARWRAERAEYEQAGPSPPGGPG